MKDVNPLIKSVFLGTHSTKRLPYTRCFGSQSSWKLHCFHLLPPLAWPCVLSFQMWWDSLALSLQLTHSKLFLDLNFSCIDILTISSSKSLLHCVLVSGLLLDVSPLVSSCTLNIILRLVPSHCASLWVISIQRGPTDFSSDLVRFPAGLTQVSTHPLLCLLLTWLISEPLFCTRFYSSFLFLLTVGVWVLLTLLPSLYHSLSFLLLLPKGLPMSISSSLWPTSPDWAF